MSAPMWEGAVEEFTKGENDSASKIISKDLLDGNLKLLGLVENLGMYLSSVDNTIRCRGTKLLADVLHQLPDDRLTEKEVELLVTYFCDRLRDHHSKQPPALHGLLALSRMKQLSDGCPEKICRGIYQEVQNQSLAQGDRRCVYTIMSNLLNTKLIELQGMGTDYVYGFIQAMDAEKDPRNLLIAFHCVRIILQNFSLGVFVEEMFEVVSCYFPIDFTPPPGDSFTITRDDLILGLRGCLSASPKFGSYCYPLLLEKMTSEIPSAKLDSFQTLTACAEVYGASCLTEFQSSFFNCIKREVFSSGNPRIEESALLALTAIISTLSVKNDQGSPVDGFLSEVMQVCNQHLTEKDLRFMVATCRLLQAAAAGSQSACHMILNHMIPVLVGLYNSHTVVGERKSIIDMIINFMKVTKKFDSNSVLSTVSGKDETVAIIMSAVSDSSCQLRRSAVQGMDVLLGLEGAFTGDMKKNVVNVLIQTAFKDEDPNAREESIAAFSTVAKTDVNLLKSSILPDLISALKTEPMEVDGVVCSCDVVFKSLKAVSISTDIITIVIKELLSHIRQLSTDSSKCKNASQSLDTVKCLSSVFESSVLIPSSLDFIYREAVPEIYNLLVSMVTRKDIEDNFIHSSEVIELLSACVRYVSTSSHFTELSEFCDKVTSLYLHGCPDGFIMEQLSAPFQPLEVTSAWTQTQLVSLLTPVICSCPPQVVSCSCKDTILTFEQTIPYIDDYIVKLSVLSVSSKHPYTQLAACICLAGLINKYLLGDKLTSFLDICHQKFKTSIKGEHKASYVTQWIWLTKSLVLRGHPLAKVYVSEVLDILEDVDIGDQAAHGFNVILSEYCDILNKSMNANIRMMYKQRLFQENVNRLSEGFQKSVEGSKKNYLIVLSYMLKFLPKQVMLGELPPLFPLLVHSLLCEDTNLHLSTMSTLYSLTHDAPDIITKHVDSLIPQLLKLCSNQQSMKVRMNALQCIGVMTLLPSHVVMPYKNEVIRTLEPVLDDRKRLVRQEAVTARGEWCLLGTGSK